MFGDSLSDVGNLTIVTGGATPGPDYYMGRLSNGPVAAEVAAQVHLGDQLTPSLTGGTGYAFDRARTGSHPDGDQYSVTSQVAEYLSTNPAADPNAWYLIWAGGNDIRDALLDQPNATAIIGSAFSDIQSTLTDLIGAGARNLSVPKAPNMGFGPG